MSNLKIRESENLLNEITGNRFAEVLENRDADDLENQLALFINYLIDKDFSRLIQLLYRIDVSEEKLQTALKNEDKSISSGKTIAKLILERQFQKLALRKQFSKKKKNL